MRQNFYSYLICLVMIQECSNLTLTCTMYFLYIKGQNTLIALNFYSVFKRLVCWFFYYYSERVAFKWGNESLCYMLSLIIHLTIHQKNRDYIMKTNILNSNISNEYCCIYKIVHILCLINNCGIV